MNLLMMMAVNLDRIVYMFAGRREKGATYTSFAVIIKERLGYKVLLRTTTGRTDPLFTHRSIHNGCCVHVDDHVYNIQRKENSALHCPSKLHDSL